MQTMDRVCSTPNPKDKELGFYSTDCGSHRGIFKQVFQNNQSGGSVQIEQERDQKQEGQSRNC